MVVVCVIILFLAGFFFIYSQGKLTGSTITGGSIIDSKDKIDNSVQEEAKTTSLAELTINASRFAFSPKVIKVKEGDRVKIRVYNTDTKHGIFIPDFNVRGEEYVEFTATKKGRYTFYCGTYCGSGHPTMQGTLIVE